jgi:BirA family biotin operon repressor/biotin-[acetyl-CoA-carboxylase] ligase
MATGRFIDRPAMAVAVLRALDLRYGQIEGAYPEIIAATSRRSSLLGRWIQVQSGTEVIEGMAEELDGDGHLLLRDGEGMLRRLSAGEVTVVAK